MKVVINTHPNYRKALAILLQSIIDSDYKDYSNIIIVDNQSPESEPTEKLISDLVELDINETIVYIGMKYNSFDYGAYNALYFYKEHKLVKDTTYFYLHDTCIVDKDWISKVQRFKPIKTFPLFGYEPFNSNIFLFHHTEINGYGDIFNREVSKDLAIDMEYKLVFFEDGRSYRPLGLRGYLSKVGTRKNIEQREDYYKTGRTRSKHYYPEFGVTKFMSAKEVIL